MERLTVYVDGSYNSRTKVYGYGIVIITDTDTLRKKGYGVDKEGVWNIAGEVTGATKAIEYALENGYEELTICHDYEGIQKWTDGEWKAKKKISSDYVNCVNDARQLGLVIHFRWVKGHSGDPYNEQADYLAKEAIKSCPKGFTLGELGKGMSFHTEVEKVSDCSKQESKEDLGKKYSKTYRTYAEDIVNQIMDYAKSTHKSSPRIFTTKILIEALHQITEDRKEI